jgi:murein DD-endopeptidase MepM/ murein hydrolase activator NlpD
MTPTRWNEPTDPSLAYHRLMKRLLIPILLLFLASAWAVGAARKSLNEVQLKQQLISNNRQKALLQKNLREVKQKQQVVTAKLHIAEQRYESARANYLQVSQELTERRVQSHIAKEKLNESETRLNQHEDALSARLEAIHQEGDTGFLQILLESGSYSDLVNQIYLYDQVMSQDADLLDEYEQAREKKAAAAQTAVSTEQKVAELTDQAAATHAVAKQAKENTAQVKQAILRQRALYERALAEMEQNSRDIQAMLQRMQTTPAGQRRLAQQFHGNFLRPVPGAVTSGYGYRMHPILGVLKMHTGVDMSASSGTPIKAAASGLVVFSGRRGGYGNCIIIDHGGGVATLYGHCSSLAVSAGREVKQGQVIGYVGSTGLSTGPHLHFEVRHNGRTVAPGF